MRAFSLIPRGLYPFIQSPFMRIVTWLRMPGDILFGLGAMAVVVFTFKAVIDVWKWRAE